MSNKQIKYDFGPDPNDTPLINQVSVNADEVENEVEDDADEEFKKKLYKTLEEFKANEEDATDDEKFDFWYPSLETWQFRRTLSYWVAVLYLEGSILFTIGAAFSMMTISKFSEESEKALVVTPYFFGGVCFMVGAYAGVLTVVNVHNKDEGLNDFCFTGGKQYRKMREYLGWEPIVAYGSYSLGAIVFQISSTAGYFALSEL